MKQRNKIINISLILLTIIGCILVVLIISQFHQTTQKQNLATPEEPENNPTEKPPVLEPTKTTIDIHAVGDCTLNVDTHFYYGDLGYDKVLEKEGPDYFLANFKDMFEKDDLTIANLELAITDADESYRVPKAFNFKAPAKVLKILTGSGVDVVNIANNHSHDYGEKGYEDTKNNLREAKLPFYGNDSYSILDVKGIKIGMAGLYCAEDEVADCKPDTLKALNYLKSQNVDMIIMTYH